MFKSWHDQLLNKLRLLVKGKLVNLCCTHEQIKLVKVKLVKENLVVCAELNSKLFDDFYPLHFYLKIFSYDIAGNVSLL